MKIVEEYNNDIANTVIEITDAAYINNYIIKIVFNDLSEKLVDFKQFLSKAVHPSISKYMDKNLFKDFNIKDGNLNWNDYDLIFSVSELYEGKIN